jgi:hypothetical protein
VTGPKYGASTGLTVIERPVQAISVIRLVAAQSLRPAGTSLVDSMIPPSTVDYQLSVDWDLYMQAVRGTDGTVAFKSMTSSVLIAVHVLIPPDVARVPRFLVRMLLPLRAQNSRSYLRSANNHPCFESCN